MGGAWMVDGVVGGGCWVLVWEAVVRWVDGWSGFVGWWGAPKEPLPRNLSRSKSFTRPNAPSARAPRRCICMTQWGAVSYCRNRPAATGGALQMLQDIEEMITK